MAKKKKSAIYQLIRTPVSIKTTGILSLMILGIVSINIHVFSNQKFAKPSIKLPTMTQTDLQNVLGTSISFGDSPKKVLGERTDSISQYWIDVIKDKPNYRDAYLILAVQAFNRRNCQDTRAYLDKTYNLDPNNKPLQDILPLLKTCLEVQQ